MSTETTKATFGTAIEALYLAFIHACRTLMKVSLLFEETTDLCRNEVGNLDELQQIRLDATKAERAVTNAINAKIIADAEKEASKP
jgi:hypothetical protein